MMSEPQRTASDMEILMRIPDGDSYREQWVPLSSLFAVFASANASAMEEFLKGLPQMHQLLHSSPGGDPTPR